MTQAESQDFPCGNCGGKLQFDAASQAMACPFCGNRQAIGPAVVEGGQGPVRVQDHALAEGIAAAPKGLGAQVTTLGCNDCGATVNVGAGERTATCAFCGSQRVLAQQTNDQAIRPESVVPFRVSKDDANKRFGGWLGGLWFRPGDLKRIAQVQDMGGVYVPFWGFGADVHSKWRAERGRYYYEEEAYTEQGQQKTRRVQKTRWEPASGERDDTYRDLLVCASKGLPQDLVDNVSKFDTAALSPYRPEFLAGWRAESYAIDLPTAWQMGQQKIDAMQTQKCAGDVGGDTQRNLQVQSGFGDVTFKHVLLPIWIAAYRYNGQVYRFLVNGQTGEVVGKAPWSVIKIVLFVFAIVVVIGAIVFFATRGKHAPPPQPAPQHAPAATTTRTR